MTIEELEADGFAMVEESSSSIGSLSDDGFEELSDDEIKAYEDEKQKEKDIATKAQTKKIVDTLLGGDNEEAPVQEAPAVEKPIDPQQQLQDLQTQDTFTQSEDATTTRPFTQAEDGVSLSPTQQDTQTQADNKAILFGTGEDYENRDIDIANIGKGLIERGNELVVNTLEGGQAVVDYAEDQFGATNTQLFQKMANWSKGTMGYLPNHDEKGVKEAFKKGGLLDIDTIQEGLLYGAEQMGKSIPDMGAMVTQLPLYIFSRTKEMADDRAKNDGRKEGNIADMAKASPFVLASVYLDRLGLKATTSDILENVGKEILKKGWKQASKTVSKEVGKGTIKEAGTEFVQEGIIEPTGERLGTDSKAPLVDIERGAFGALAGGVGGGGISSVTATGQQLHEAYTVDRQKKARDNYINSMKWSSLSPEKQNEEHLANVQAKFTDLVRGYSDVSFPADILDDIDMQEQIVAEAESQGVEVPAEADTQSLEEVGQSKFDETNEKIKEQVQTNLSEMSDKELQDRIDKQQETIDSDKDSAWSEVHIQTLLEEKKKREGIGNEEEAQKDTGTQGDETSVSVTEDKSNDKETQTISNEELNELYDLQDRQHDEDFTEEQRERMWELEDIPTSEVTEEYVEPVKEKEMGSGYSNPPIDSAEGRQKAVDRIKYIKDGGLMNLEEYEKQEGKPYVYTDHQDHINSVASQEKRIKAYDDSLSEQPKEDSEVIDTVREGYAKKRVKEDDKYIKENNISKDSEQYKRIKEAQKGYGEHFDKTFSSIKESFDNGDMQQIQDKLVMGGGFESYKKALEGLYDIKFGTSRKSTIEAIDSYFDGKYKEFVENQQEEAKKQQKQKKIDDMIADLESEQVNDGGTVKSRKQFLDEKFADGYTEIVKVKKGATNRYSIKKGSSQYDIKSKEVPYIESLQDKAVDADLEAEAKDMAENPDDYLTAEQEAHLFGKESKYAKYGEPIAETIEEYGINLGGMVAYDGKDAFAQGMANATNAILLKEKGADDAVVTYQLEKALDNLGKFWDSYDEVSEQAKRISAFKPTEIWSEIQNSLREKLNLEEDTQQIHTKDIINTQQDIIEITKEESNGTEFTFNGELYKHFPKVKGGTGTDRFFKKDDESGSWVIIQDKDLLKNIEKAYNETASERGTDTESGIRTDGSGNVSQSESETDRGDGGTDDTGTKEPDSRPETERPAKPISDERDSGKRLHNKQNVKNQFVVEQNDAVTQGEVNRFSDNMVALKLVKSNKTFYSKEDLQALSRYTGWGGVQKLFPTLDGKFDNETWRERNRAFRDTVSVEEYESAKKSILDAFYTPPKVIGTMWDISERLGFDGGNVLEPSAGTGRFIGMTPKNLKNVSFDGIELDPVTSKIAQILYPKSNIRNIGFEKTNHKNSFNLVVGNPPYGDFKVYDPQNAKASKLNIHNYFMVKSLQALKDGGVLNFVITSSFMENLNKTTATMINEQAKLVGAIRLPNNVFKGAGTEVTTDIVIFQKLRDGEEGNIDEWFGSVKQDNGIKLNKYFNDNPKMLLGSWEKGFRGNKSVAVLADFDTLLNDAINQLPENIMDSFQGELRAELDNKADTSVPPSVFYEKDGKYYFNVKDNERIEAQELKGTMPKDYMKLRDSLKKVIAMQNDSNTKTADLDKARKELNKHYDYFKSKHGLLNKVATRNIIVNDNFGYTVLSLEQEGKKAPIFTKRTSNPTKTIKTKDTKEALTIVLNSDGKVDIESLEDITGKSEEVIVKELQGEIYFDVTENKYVPKEVYLSGDVKTKLAEATDKKAIDELLKVIPKDLQAKDIPVQMGASWVEPKYIEQFAKEQLGFGSVRATFNPALAKWEVQGYSRSNPYDIPRYSDADTLEKALNQKKITIKTSVRGGSPVIDEDATAFANQKLEDLKDDFANWVFKDAKRSENLTSLYNELYNRNVLVDVNDAVNSYDVPNTSEEFVARHHQKRAVYRAVYGDSPLLLNHPVGSGKTFTSQMIAMEWKRLGIANKPIIATLKSVVPQFAREFKIAYPNANILVPTERDFQAKNRKRLLSSIATGDYDAIILTHDNLKALKNPTETEREILEERIAELEASLADADGRSKSQIQKRIEKIKNQYEVITNVSKDDDVLSFDQLGIDGIIVDESHKFKKIGFTSTLDIKGIDTEESQMGVDLLIKTRHILKNSKNVILMTGTPITNTLPELFAIQRLLQPELLKKQGIFEFDSWAKQYTITDTDIEVTGTGKFKEIDRIKRYVNLDSLLSSVGQIMDTVTNDEIKANDKSFILPPLKGGEPTQIVLEPSDLQLEYAEELDQRLAEVNDKENDDNYLAIFGDASRMSLDIRFVIPEAKDSPTSKASVATDIAVKKYKEFDKQKGVQLIFSDIGIPNSDGRFDLYNDIKRKLVEKGIPEKEVALISSYNTAKEKAELSKKAKAGEIRFVIGSTQKLGTGINMQDRLVAIHNLDIPYTPAELEQRMGRILRQGNKLIKEVKGFEVEIVNYATAKTLDGSKWQILKNKLQFISQFQEGNIDEELDIDEGSSKEQAERMIALASGNPLLLDRVKAEKELKKLRALKRGYNQARNDNLQALGRFKETLEGADSRVESLEADKKEIDSNEIKINGKTFEKQGELGQAVLDEILKYKEARGRNSKKIGNMGAIDIAIDYDYATGEATVSMVGKNKESIKFEFLTQKAVGLGAKVSNVLDVENYQKKIDATKNNKKVAEERIPAIENSLKETFNKEDELEAVQKKLDDINQEMQTEAKGTPVEETTGETVSLRKRDADEPMPNNPKSFKELGEYPQRPKNEKLTVGNATLPMPKTVTYPVDVKELLVDLVGERFYSGNLARWKAGEFRHDSGVVRLQSMNDIESMGHEVAHYLDHKKDKNQRYINGFKKFKERNKSEISSYSYTSNEKIVESEGFAELMRAYFTQSEQLVHENKKLYDELELALKGLGEKKYGLIKKIQAKSHFYVNQGAELMNKSAIAPHKQFKDRFFDFKDKVLDHNENITSFVDIAHPAKVIAKDLGLEQGYKASNPYIQFRLATGHAESVIEGITKYGTATINPKDGSLKYSGEGLSDVFAPALESMGNKKSNNETLDDLFRYFQLVQAKYQMEEEGKATSFTLENIEAELPELEKRKGFVESHEKWLDFNDRMLQFYVDMGHLTKKQAQDFKEENPLYVPTHRVIASLDDGASGAGGRGFKARSKMGSERTLLPVENIFTQIENQVTNALVARAKQTLFKGITSKQEGAKWASYIPKKSKRYKAIMEQQAKHFAEVMFDEGMIIDTEGKVVPISEDNMPHMDMKGDMIEAMSKKIEENPELTTFYSYGHKPFSLDGSIVSVIIDDTQKFFEINKGSKEGRLLLNMLNGIDSTYKRNALLGLAHGTKNIMTRSIVTTPNFILGNLFVDTTTAGVYSKTNFIPAVDSGAGAKSVTMEDKDFKLFVLNGGAFGTRVEMATKEARKRQMMKLAIKEKSMARALNTYDRAVSIGEMATRMGEYKGALKKGIDPMASAYLGTEITTDFNMHGSNTSFNALRSTVAFLPASINSLYKDYREFGGTDTIDRKKHFLNLALKGFAYITIPAIISMLSDDDDDRTVAEDARYSHYKVGDEVYKHKTQFLLGLLFEKAPKLAKEAFIRDNGEKAWEIAKVGVWSMLVPDATPTIASPFVDLMRNKNFMGSPIVTSRLKNRTGEASYTQYTERTPLMFVEASAGAKQIGINVSPAKMQYLTEAYLGYVSKWIEDSTNRIMWDEDMHGEMPDKNSLAYLTHHFKYKDYGQSYWNEQYYKAQDKVLQIDAEISASKEFILRDKGATLKKVMENKQKIAVAKTADAFTKIESRLSKLRQQSTIIRYNKKLTSKQKDKQLLELNKLRTKVLKIEFLELDKIIKEYEKTI